jgi:hypothetical protein
MRVTKADATRSPYSSGVSTKKKFLFIHVPKTGGTSIRRVLRPYFDWQFSLHRTAHATSQDYQREIPHDVYDSLFKFCCVRNPWEREMSYHFHRYNEWNRDLFIEDLLKDRGQLSFYDPYQMDFIMRFENLEEDFGIVCQQLGLKLELPHMNSREMREKTDSVTPYHEYYDVELQKMVQLKCDAEIQMFDYKFEGKV